MLNKVQLIGRIGNIESKTLPNGTFFTKLSLAVNKSWKDAQGVRQEKTLWVNIHSFQKLAEIIADKAKKGQLIYVEGELKQNAYKNKDGVETISTSVLASEFKRLSFDDNKDSSKSVDNSVKVGEPGLLDDDIPW